MQRLQVALLALVGLGACDARISSGRDAAAQAAPSTPVPETPSPTKPADAAPQRASESSGAMAEVAPEPEAPRGVPVERGPVVMRIYLVDRQTKDPFGDREPPPGIQMRVRYKGGPPARGEERQVEQRLAAVEPVDGETLADAIARVRPWFEALEVPPDRKWRFHALRNDRGVPADRGDVTLVMGEPVLVHAGDIAQIEHRPGAASTINVIYTPGVRDRLREETAGFVDQEVVYVVQQEVVATEKLTAQRYASPAGLSKAHEDQLETPLVFTEDTAFAGRLIAALRGD